jgi:guanine nucleotide-binding protein G(i) subunit alpha
MQMYDIIPEPQNVSAYAMVLALPPSFTTPLPPRITDALLALWADFGVQDAVFRLQDVVLDSHALYLLDALARVLDTGYVPTEQDILRARKPAAGLEETVLRAGELTYRLLDTAGLFSERRKWLHLLEDVTVVLFVVSLAQYDEMLYEDGSIVRVLFSSDVFQCILTLYVQNKMHEALTLFDSFCNSRWFVNTSIIFFLDDGDLFAEKLPRSPLGDYFPDYTGGDSYDAACDYLLHRFVSLNQSAATKQIHAHYTCASDAEKFKCKWRW